MRSQQIKGIVGGVTAYSRPRSVAVLKDWTATLELKHGPNLECQGSSGEYWTMRESVIQWELLQEFEGDSQL
jgi:hypothetical protein